MELTAVSPAFHKPGGRNRVVCENSLNVAPAAASFDAGDPGAQFNAITQYTVEFTRGLGTRNWLGIDISACLAGERYGVSSNGHCLQG